VFAYGRCVVHHPRHAFAVRGIGLTILQGSTINFTDQGIRPGHRAAHPEHPECGSHRDRRVPRRVVLRPPHQVRSLRLRGRRQRTRRRARWCSTRRVKVLILVISGSPPGSGSVAHGTAGCGGPHRLDHPPRLGCRDRDRWHRAVGRCGGVGRTVLGVLILTVLSNGLSRSVRPTTPRPSSRA
jgi:ribose transport system permease protein